MNGMKYMVKTAMRTGRGTLFVMLLSLVMTASCSGGGEKKHVLVASKGLPSELLLVVDGDVWNSDLKDTVNAIVEGQVPGLVQAEHMFRVTRIFSRDYKPTHTTFHSKLFVKVDKTLDKPMMGMKRNGYAKPQLELVVAAPSVEELRTFLSANGQRIAEMFADFQVEMRVGQLKKKYSKKVSDDLKSTLGMTVNAPEHMQATKSGECFMWASTNLVEKDLNLVVYTYDWHGENVADTAVFIAKRDSVMKKNIPGEREDQWMQTAHGGERNLPLVECHTRGLYGQQVVESRGLWEMRNGALGGPFVSLVRVDTIHNRVVAAEGFVYSPSTEKRDLVRTMEAVLRTLKEQKK